MLLPQNREISRFRPDVATRRHNQAPLIAECLANLECGVADAGMVDKYNLFILEVTKVWSIRSRPI